MTAPPEAPERLRRSRDQRVVGGVLGGLADHTGIDPVVFRVVAVVGVLFGGAWLLAAYVAAWLLLPDGDDGASALEDRDVSKLLLVVVGVVAALALPSVLGGPFGHRWHGGGIGFFLLVGLGIWLWKRDQGDEERPTTTAAAASEVSATSSADAPRPGRQSRSILGRLTLSVAALVAGTLALLDVADVVALEAGTLLASLLLVVGAGLLVGSRYGRARWLVPLALLLTVLTTVATVADVPLRGGAGERRWAPRAPEELRDTYRLGAGEAVLDLSGLDLDGRRRRVEVSLGMGELRVLLPLDAALDVDAHVGFGELELRGRGDDGVDLDRELRIAGRDGSLDLVARVGMGRLEVR